MKSNKKKIALFAFGIILILTAIGFAVDEYFDRQEEQQKHQTYAQLIPLIGLEANDGFETKVDKVRSFLFEHTQFDMSPEFYALWGNHPVIAERIKAHAKGLNDNRAPLECSARSGVLESIYQTLGYKTRSVSVYKHAPNYPSHTFSEVQNPQTKEWHVQDTQNDLFWRMKDSKKRASIHDLIKHDKSAYTPCRTNQHCIEWNTENREGEKPELLEKYYDSASIIDHNNNSRPFLVNAKRFDLNTPVKIDEKESMTYCNYRRKNCRDEIIIFD
ncbi:MAG: hypothetical protein KAJ29_05890 [Alphaproteobacteria bacterium]|nr:hypothetical protein [Alphaproteobacteria bacterium]